MARNVATKGSKGRVSVLKFAEVAKVSERTVSRYRDAWNAAALAGRVKAATDLTPNGTLETAWIYPVPLDKASKAVTKTLLSYLPKKEKEAPEPKSQAETKALADKEAIKAQYEGKSVLDKVDYLIECAKLEGNASKTLKAFLAEILIARYNLATTGKLNARGKAIQERETYDVVVGGNAL